MDNTFKKSPTAFLANRFALNKQIQAQSKKRIEKEIEYFKTDDTQANGTPIPDPYEGSDFHGNNQGLDMQVDGNSAILAGNCPFYNPNRFKSGAKLRIMTPGFRENSAKYEDAFYTADARAQGDLSSACGLAPHFIKTLKGETLQLDQATFLKVTCGTTATIFAAIGTTTLTYKFLTCSNLHPSAGYLTWTDGTNNYYTYTDWWWYRKDCDIFSNTTLTTKAGFVKACLVPDTFEKPMLAGMFRSLELDTTIGQTNYYGWFYFGNDSYAEFTQVYTTAEKPAANAPIFLLNADTGAMVQFPAAFKVADWSAPATMFDVDYTYDYVPSADVDIPITKNEVNDKIKIDEGPSITPTSLRYNLRALIAGYNYAYLVSQITVTDGEETPTTLGTFNFDSYYGNYRAKWKNTSASAAQQYVYTYDREAWAGMGVCTDEELETGYGVVSSVTISDTPEEAILYLAYAAPDGRYTSPRELMLGVHIDFTSTDRREMLLEEYDGVDITPYITQKWWNTANIGYGEVSSQTTLYTETVFRYKDLDAHLKDYLPADWKGDAYGCIIVADSSANIDKFSGNKFLGVSHTDFFQDGSDVYYIIPANAESGDAGENGPYDLVHAYVYDAALNSIYSTNFAIDTTSGSTTVTHHYISDATKNYQVGGDWRYHYACIEDKNQDIWAKRLSYSFSDLYYLVNGVETPLNPDTQVLVTPQLFPYATIYRDNTSYTEGNNAWYDFVHRDINQTTGFVFSSTFRPQQITATPTGGSAVTLNRYSTWDGEGYYAWEYVNGETITYVYTTSAQPSVGDTIYNEDKSTWGVVTTLVAISRSAQRVRGYDTEKTVDDVATNMYCWQFLENPDDEDSRDWNFYTTDLVPTTASHLWYQDETWIDTGFTPTTITTAPQTWYRYTTSIKEIYAFDEEGEPLYRFQHVWATSRNPYTKGAMLVHSNYDVNAPMIPTTPDINREISFDIDYQAYIAPAYQMVVTYKGEDFTFTADYTIPSFDFKGILYSSWVNEESGQVLYTARITPRVGDKLYMSDGKAAAIATDFTIKEVKSIVDFIYSGRL